MKTPFRKKRFHKALYDELVFPAILTKSKIKKQKREAKELREEQEAFQSFVFTLVPNPYNFL